MNYRNNLRQKLVDLLIDKSKQEALHKMHVQNGKESNPGLVLYTKNAVLIDLAVRIEDKIFSLFKHGKPYNDKSRSIIFNLCDTKNLLPLYSLLTK